MIPRTFYAARAAVVIAIAWGVVAFGAVYPWAYWPLVGLAFLAAAMAIVAAGPVGVPQGGLIVGILLLAGAIGAQMVPLPVETLAKWTPMTMATLRQLDVRFAIGLSQKHAISLDPALTGAGLVIFLACSALALAVARFCSAYGVTWLTTSVTVLGVIVALIGIIQKPLYAGKIYGFWTPISAGSPFGPFVNRNHFAGWMMMALPVTLGALCAGIDKGMQGVRPVWRDRLLWLGSRNASQLLMQGVASAIMGLSLVLTMSRSGIGAFGLAVALIGAFVVFGVSGGARKTVATLYMAGLFALVVGWVGIGAIANQFETTNWKEYNDRRGAWQDATDIATMFPLTGTGFGAYGVATMLYQKHDLARHYVQAHNDYLQLRAEGGALLIVPAALLALLISWQVGQRFRDGSGSATSWWVRVGALAGLVAMSMQEAVDFSLQMPGNAVLCAVLIGVALHRAPMTSARRIRIRNVEG